MLHKLLNHYYTHKFIFSFFRRFRFAGQTFAYFVHRYNATWRNERAVEVPVVWAEVERAYAEGKRVLEIGNVLAHYFPSHHDVLDKYEVAPGVINEDIVKFSPKQQYDLIVSISTLEHVGWDETPKSKTKTVQAVEQIRSWLNKGGRAVITVPLGYNPHLDQLLASGKLGFDDFSILQRISVDNQWREVDDSVIGKAKYGEPFGNANAVVVGTVSKQ